MVIDYDSGWHAVEQFFYRFLPHGLRDFCLLGLVLTFLLLPLACYPEHVWFSFSSFLRKVGNSLASGPLEVHFLCSMVCVQYKSQTRCEREPNMIPM